MFKIMRCSFRVAGVTLALLWLFQASAEARIYKWRDDQGKMHYTDSKSKIPAKYRENVQKFKGVVEPKPKVEAPPEEEPEAFKPDEEPQAASQPPPPEEKPKFTEEELAQLKVIHDYLVEARRFQVGLLNKGFTKSLAEDYFRIAPDYAKSKKKEAKKIRETTVPSLMKARAYLKKSAAQDRRESMEEDGFMDRVERLRKRLERTVPKLNKIIDDIKTDLGMELVPHPTLVDHSKNKNSKKSGR